MHEPSAQQRRTDVVRRSAPPRSAISASECNGVQVKLFRRNETRQHDAWARIGEQRARESGTAVATAQHTVGGGGGGAVGSAKQIITAAVSSSAISAGGGRRERRTGIGSGCERLARGGACEYWCQVYRTRVCSYSARCRLRVLLYDMTFFWVLPMCDAGQVLWCDVGERTIVL